MLFKRIVDNCDVDEMLWYNSTNIEKKGIKSKLIKCVSIAKEFFVNMQKHCESFESFVNNFNFEKLQTRIQQRLNERYHPKKLTEQDILMENEISTQYSGSVSDYRKSESQEFDRRVNNKKTGVLMKFKDNPNCKIKQNRRKSENSKPRSCPKPAYFKLKLIRLYAKAIKKIINPPKKDFENRSNTKAVDIIDFFDDEFTKHTKENKETLQDIPPKMAESNKKNSWYRSIFEKKNVVAENLSFFLENFFENDILSLEKKLGFSCCDGIHDGECREKWIELRRWVFVEFTGLY